jgi:hypothetical protein
MRAAFSDGDFVRVPERSIRKDDGWSQNHNASFADHGRHAIRWLSQSI